MSGREIEDGLRLVESGVHCTLADFVLGGDLDLLARRMEQLARHAENLSLQAKEEGAARGR
ncbi:MAG: hypothetical protein V8T51_08530 [Senegalimassilia faecalis]